MMPTTEYKAIDEFLSIRNGHLFIDDIDTVDLVKKYGSPIYVVSERQLRNNITRYKEAFSASWPDGPVDILPALKANWTLATRRILTDEGAGADVYSPGELYAALKENVDRDRISVNGGGKSEEMIQTCIRHGVRITVEDLDEPELIDRIAQKLGKTARIRFRIKPDFPNLWKSTEFATEWASIDLGTQIYKGGIPAQYLPDLGRKVLAMKHVELTGFHFHGGRHRADLWFWRGAMKMYARLIVDLCREWGGYRPKEIDIGGGFAVNRDPHDKLHVKEGAVRSFFMWPLMLLANCIPTAVRYRLFSLLLEKGFVGTPNAKTAPSVEEYAAAAAGMLHEEFRRLEFNTTGIRLQVEPGRNLYGNAGIHLTSVKKVKRQTRPIKLNWILTDTTFYFLIDVAVQLNFHHFIVANRACEGPVMVADVVGQSCAGDRILPFVRVPQCAPGDVIAILDTGAYQETAASNFNALPRPATVLVNRKVSAIIKKAETVEDVFSRDVIPGWLKLKKSSSRQWNTERRVDI